MPASNKPVDVTDLTYVKQYVDEKVDNLTASDVGLGNVGNFKAVSTVANQGLSDAEMANARTNIGLF